jgi:hypothetical protein
MYFGLIEVPTYYMDLMNTNFMEYLDKFVMVFINNVLVYTKDEEHEEHLHLELYKLQDCRLYTMMRKYEFWLKQATFMSHVILEEGISVDSSKIQDMLTWNTSASVASI